MIDFVLEDVNRLRPRLASNDQRKVDEYLNSVREVELRIARASQPKRTIPMELLICNPFPCLRPLAFRATTKNTLGS
jgi:hypothetical protein